MVNEKNGSTISIEQFPYLDHNRSENLIEHCLHGLLVCQVQRAEELLELRCHPVEHVQDLFAGHVTDMPHQISLALQLGECRKQLACARGQPCHEGRDSSVFKRQDTIRD